MDVVEGLPGEFSLLRRELTRVSDCRFARAWFIRWRRC